MQGYVHVTLSTISVFVIHPLPRGRSRTHALPRRPSSVQHRIRSDRLYWGREQRLLPRLASQEVCPPPLCFRPVPSSLYILHSGATRDSRTLPPPSQDVVLCRRFRGLEHRIADERAKGPSSRLSCTVEYWSGAWEVEEKFKLYAQRTSLGAIN